MLKTHKNSPKSTLKERTLDHSVLCFSMFYEYIEEHFTIHLHLEPKSSSRDAKVRRFRRSI